MRLGAGLPLSPPHSPRCRRPVRRPGIQGAIAFRLFRTRHTQRERTSADQAGHRARHRGACFGCDPPVRIFFSYRPGRKDPGKSLRSERSLLHDCSDPADRAFPRHTPGILRRHPCMAEHHRVFRLNDKLAWEPQ